VGHHWRRSQPHRNPILGVKLSCCASLARGNLRCRFTQDLMIVAAEHCFGPVNRLPHTIEWYGRNLRMHSQARLCPRQFLPGWLIRDGPAAGLACLLQPPSPATGSRLSFTPRVHRGTSNPGSLILSLRGDNTFICQSRQAATADVSAGTQASPPRLEVRRCRRQMMQCAKS
jgi:hypothetical protein